MHRSRLAAIGIDCPSESALATAAFWSAALDPESSPPTGFAEADPYLGVGAVAGREVFVQQIDGPSGVHLDIETDDVEAEVSRLDGHGAKRIRQVKTWWILEDPSGQPFCVVRPQTDDLSWRCRRLGLTLPATSGRIGTCPPMDRRSGWTPVTSRSWRSTPS